MVLLSTLYQLEPAPNPWSRPPKNPEIDGLRKLYKSIPKKEDHPGKMRRTDTVADPGEC